MPEMIFPGWFSHYLLDSCRWMQEGGGREGSGGLAAPSERPVLSSILPAVGISFSSWYLNKYLCKYADKYRFYKYQINSLQQVGMGSGLDKHFEI